MDTIAAGVTVAFAMECYEKGILTKEDTGGLELKFGNALAVFALIEMIARRIKRLLVDGDARPGEIAVVFRSDGSGTTFIFTDYLSKTSPEWQQKVGNSTSVNWPGCPSAAPTSRPSAACGGASPA